MNKFPQHQLPGCYYCPKGQVYKRINTVAARAGQWLGFLCWGTLVFEIQHRNRPFGPLSAPTHTPALSYTLGTIYNFIYRRQLTNKPVCLLSMGGDWSSRGKPTWSQKECTNSSCLSVVSPHCFMRCKNNSRAREVMQQQKPPLNCREAFTAAGDQVFTNRYYSSEMDRARYLGSDVEAEISQLELEVNNKMAQVSHFQQQLHSVGEEIKINETHMKTKQMQIRKIQGSVTKIKLEITDLENVDEPQSVDISTLEEEMQDICQRIESHKEKLEQARKNMDVHRKTLDEAEQKYKEMKEKINVIAEEADSIKDELSRIDTEVGKCKHHKRHYEEKKREHMDGIDKLKENLESKETILEENTAKAKQIFAERIEVTRSPKSIDMEINHLRERINREQERHGNKEEITRQYYDVLETYKNVKSQIKNLKKFMQLLHKIMEERHKAYNIFRRYISLRCKYYFDSMLSQRGYHGKMSFDHKNATLSIAVQPGEGDKAALSDMRSLSGGERSFSTVCFILSLWDTMESPFRCLDEFDVYMDMVNRRISMDMMLKVANSQRYRQFIFLTPQSMSSLPFNRLIRILRMHDPERGQTTLPFRPLDQAEDSDE